MSMSWTFVYPGLNEKRTFLRETNLKMYIIIFLDGYPYKGMDIRHSLKIKRYLYNVALYVHVQYFEYYVNLILSLTRSIS